MSKKSISEKLISELNQSLFPPIIPKKEWFQCTPVLAVSGGKDSMLLLHFFHGLYQKKAVLLPLIFHLNHKIRYDADQDLLLVMKVCEELGLPLVSYSKNTLLFAQKTGMCLEEAGRTLRYRTLAKIIQSKYPRQNAYAVTAHHADDYLETILIQMIRGCGPQALSTLSLCSRVYGLPVFRPFLRMNQKQIDQMIEKYNISYREDSTNYSQKFLRNRLRSHVTPILFREGLSSGKLWENFHDTNLYFSHKDIQNFFIDKVDYLYLDRRLLEEGLGLKRLLDVCLKRLQLKPLKRSALVAIQDQVVTGDRFKIRYICPEFQIWSSFASPIWIFSRKAAIFKDFRYSFIRKDGSEMLYNVQYNHISCEFSLGEEEELGRFREGLRSIPSNHGSKKLKKVFQELQIPAPLRPYLPLVFHRKSRRVQRILLSFWENKQDKVFHGYP